MSDHTRRPSRASFAERLNVALVGGGAEGAAFLRLATEDKVGTLRFRICGVANLNLDSPCVRMARKMGVPLITRDFQELYQIPDLDLIVELTGYAEVRSEIERSRPPQVKLIDSFAASMVWELYTAQEAKSRKHATANKRLEEERKRISLIFNSLPDEVLVLDPDLVVQDANAVFLERNGHRIEECRGRNCYDLAQRVRGECPVDVQGCPAYRALNEKQTTSQVRQFFDESGASRYAALVASPVLDERGDAVGIIESVRDITHRIRLEEELEATERRLKRFMEKAPVAIYVKNAFGQYLEVNQALADLIGREREQILGKTDVELLERETAESLRASDRRVLKNREEVKEEVVVKLKDHRVFLSTIKYPLLDPDGTVQAVCGISMDISGLKEAELELVRTSQYLRNVLDNSPVIIITTDLEGKIVSFNPGAEESLGYGKEEVIGTPAYRFYREPEERDELLRRVTRDGSVRDFLTMLVRKDGTPVPVSITLAQLKDSQGRMIGTVGMSKDISKRQALINQVMQSERLAAVGRLAAGVAHEINNPLAVIGEIAGYLNEVTTADREPKDPEIYDELRTGLPKIIAQVARCQTITHRLLLFSRKSEAKVETADVNASLEEILPFLEKEARLARAAIHCDYAEELPRVRMEEMQLQEIFINLVHNAIQALDAQGKGGDIWIVTRQGEDGSVIVSFEDNGPGIAEEVKDRLFDPFVTTKPPGQGTGLGLSICYGIVKRYGGEIIVDSPSGQGTTFRLILPPHTP